jgi:Ca2+ transporting ATPase
MAFAFANVQDTDIHHYHLDSSADYSQFEHNLTFVLLVSMLNPPWPKAYDAIATCMAVGICVICITGDKKGTAKSICQSIRIFDADEDLMGKSYTDRKFDDLSHTEKVIAV